MKMIAIGTVHANKLIRPANPELKLKAKFANFIAKPGEEFESEDFGIDDKEASRLVELKAAKRKTKEVADDGDKAAGVKPTGKAIDNMNVAELTQIAADRGVQVKPGATKAELIAALNAPAA
jgi:hypothetical protein